MADKKRIAGYVASFLSASTCYLSYFVLQEGRTGRSHSTGFLFNTGLAFFFFIFEGAGVALLLMLMAWPLAVLGYRSIRQYGMVYFSCFGAAGMLVFGSITSSLAPKPLFIEDQTFWEGFSIAVQRQGLCLVLTGVCFGLTFWLLNERCRYLAGINK